MLCSSDINCEKLAWCQKAGICRCSMFTYKRTDNYEKQRQYPRWTIKTHIARLQVHLSKLLKNVDCYVCPSLFIITFPFYYCFVDVSFVIMR